ncbi:MAG: glutamyl-tRNA amidotransferase [Legionellales bacterium]|nr:glutamyl-tRNA amidotransferase [Legionellales bacterium]HAG61747.1 glutamyl-tRNA amidotransferase [Coxiellaceae bacterium]|tara:strand:- start:2058 stop:2513 length:456 start_codon:yes stop_codon:yes gene_type:complete
MSNPSLIETINEDIKSAMRSKDSERLTTLRMLKAAIKQRDIDTQSVATDQDALAIINKMVKQRKESTEQYLAAQRPELAEKEQLEIRILTAYLPEQLDEAAILTAIDQAITESGAQSIKDMGAVMGLLKSQLQGQADMSIVSKHVRTRLST